MTDNPSDPQARLQRLIAEFDAKNFAACVALARQMVADKQIHPVQAMILVIAAEAIGDDGAIDHGMALVDHICTHALEAIATMAKLEAMAAPEFLRKWTAERHYPKILKHLKIARRIDPSIATVFGDDPDRLAARLLSGRLPDQTPHQTLAHFASVAGSSRPKRRALILGRKYFFDPTSREHDILPRMARGITLGGWDCRFLDPTYPIERDPNPVTLTVPGLLATIKEYQADCIFIDHFGLRMSLGEWGALGDQLRQWKPEIRLAHLSMDPWIAATWPMLKSIGAQVDVIWSHFPAGAYWDTLGLRDKLAYHPFPIGIELSELDPVERMDKTVFQGAVETYNSSRAYWIALLDKVGIPVEQRVTTHSNDGLGPIESYRRYLSRFRSAQRLLSFSMRSDGSRIVTGRSFETIFSGGCLIQERADDLDSFFTPGEHYFRFETFDDLRDLLSQLHAAPEKALAVAAQGQAYYLAHYNDRRLVDYLEAALF
jgi:hypothetical protein